MFVGVGEHHSVFTCGPYLHCVDKLQKAKNLLPDGRSLGLALHAAHCMQNVCTVCSCKHRFLVCTL